MSTEAPHRRKRQREEDMPFEHLDAAAEIDPLEAAAKAGDAAQVERLLAAKANVGRNDGRKLSLIIEHYYATHEPKERDWESAGDRLARYCRSKQYVRVYVQRSYIVGMLKKAESEHRRAVGLAVMMGLHPRTGAGSALRRFSPHPGHSTLADFQVMRIALGLVLGSASRRPEWLDELRTEKEIQLGKPADIKRQPAIDWVLTSEYGTISQINALLTVKTNPNGYYEGRSHLHTAVLREGPDTHPTQTDYQVKKHGGLLERDPAIVEALLKAKANPNNRDNKGRTVLIEAIMQNQAWRVGRAGGEKSKKIIELLLANKALPNEVLSSTQESALMIAANHQDENAVKLLLKFNADIAYSRWSQHRGRKVTAIDCADDTPAGLRIKRLLKEAQQAEQATASERTTLTEGRYSAAAALVGQFSASSASSASTAQPMQLSSSKSEKDPAETGSALGPH